MDGIENNVMADYYNGEDYKRDEKYIVARTRLACVGDILAHVLADDPACFLADNIPCADTSVPGYRQGYVAGLLACGFAPDDIGQVLQLNGWGDDSDEKK